MSQMSSFTSKFRAHKPTSNASASGRVIKRQRDSLVCTQCRISKTKCDRGQPCSSCVHRNNPEGCDYQKNVPTTSDQAHLGLVGHKLAHLESMVKQLIDTPPMVQTDGQSILQRQQHAGDERHDRHELDDSTRCDKADEANYTGSTHWSAILDDLQDLSALLRTSPEAQDAEDPPPARLSHISDEPIFGAYSKFSLQEIISEYLPTKADVDRLLSLYFQGPIFIIPILHTYQFERQYRQFWENPMDVRPLWLSILFSICFMSSEARKVTEPSAPPLKQTFRGNAFLHTAAGQCLVLGEFNRPQELTVEALVMYAQCKHIHTLDPSREAGVVLSIAVRTAYHLGYHRDPDSSGSLSVFEGEMRRRCWAICRQMDLMTSFELGLPSNIYLENSDTKSPRNLWDSDFDEDTEDLPPARCENEATRQLWFIVKDKMMESFSKVCRDALAFHVKSEAEVLELDQEIRQMYDNIPEVLRIRPLSESITDAPFIIFCRVYVEFIYLKCLCVLHRRYMAKGSASSTASCLDAGKKLVGHFIELAREFSPGGSLYMQRWMLTNYTMNDFLLGVMVLCFAVHTNRNKLDSSMMIDINSEKEILTLLESAHSVLLDKSETCRDARRVSHIVRLILDNSKTSLERSSHSRPPSGVAQNLEPTQRETTANHDEPFSGSLEPFTFLNNPTGEFDWSLFDLDVFNQDTF